MIVMQTMADLASATLHVPALVPMDVPNPGAGTAPPGVGPKFIQIMGWAKWLFLGLLVIGLMAAGVMMGFGGRRGEGGEHANRLAWVLGGVILVSGAFTIVSFMAT